MNENNPLLQKLSRLLNVDSLITQEDIIEIQKVLVGVLANNKKELESLTEEAKTTIERLLDKIIDEHNTYLERTKQIAQGAKFDTTEAIKELKATQKSFEEVKKLCQEVMDCKPEDGDDADEEMIIEEVLAKIRLELPEYKEDVVDDGTDIVAKINELPVNEDNQIDARHIKNLPEFKNGRWSGITKGAVLKLIEENGGGGGGGTGLTWNEVTGTSQTAAINNGYIANNASLVTVTLPTTAALGSIVEVAGLGAGLFKVAQNSGQVINFGNQATTTGTGGSITAVHRYDSLRMVCVVANTTWNVIGSVGNLTIV